MVLLILDEVHDDMGKITSDIAYMLTKWETEFRPILDPVPMLTEEQYGYNLNIGRT